jgi:hypothetical protein
MTLGRLFKWLKHALDIRKSDIIRRAAIVSNEKEDRALKTRQKEERLAKKEADLLDSREKFNDEHKEDIDIYNTWKSKLAEGGEDYNDEEDEEDGEEKQSKEPPVLP